MYRKYLTLAVLYTACLHLCDLLRGQSVDQLSLNLHFTLSARSSVWLILHLLLQDEVRQLLMRKSSTFARGVSKYRGVTKHKVDQLTDIAQRTGTCHYHLLPVVTQNAVESPQELCSLPLVCVVCCVLIGYLAAPLQPAVHAERLKALQLCAQSSEHCRYTHTLTFVPYVRWISVGGVCW